jgi:hypothetical protein
VFRLSRLFVVAAVLAAVVPGLSVDAAADGTTTPRVWTPNEGAGVELGIPMVISGEFVVGETGGLERVEISFDGGETWGDSDIDDNQELFTYTYTPTRTGRLDMLARVTFRGEVREPAVMRSVEVGGPGTPRPMIQPEAFDLPWVAARPLIRDPDTQAVELGLRVRFDRDGFVTGARIRRHQSSSASFTFWAADGTPLAHYPYGAAMSGQITFPSPVPVTAGTQYVVSYYAPNGGYPSSENYFTGTVTRSPFIAPHDGITGAGVYHYGDGGGFPSDTWHDSNYWIEPIFTPFPAG